MENAFGLMDWTGLLSTAGKLVFGGSIEGQFFAPDTATGKELWRTNTGAQINAAVVVGFDREKLEQLLGLTGAA